MYTSRYNVFDAQGQLTIAPGDPIDQAEAERQGIIRPALVEVAAAELPSPEVEIQALEQPSATAERKARR